ncbi:MAG: HIT family protein, partial [Erysipelotrichaceae bacterium]|nr:HIT family protein [Erysipelotrichaceae bacterium]
MCLFCDIVEGKIPSSRVYEDDLCVAFLVIAQATKGHTLVVPKQHFDNILQCDQETLKHLICVTQQLAAQLIDKLQANGCNILVNTNEAAGQTIKHLHFHLIPR